MNKKILVLIIIIIFISGGIISWKYWGMSKEKTLASPEEWPEGLILVDADCPSAKILYLNEYPQIFSRINGIEEYEKLPQEFISLNNQEWSTEGIHFGISGFLTRADRTYKKNGKSIVLDKGEIEKVIRAFIVRNSKFFGNPDLTNLKINTKKQKGIIDQQEIEGVPIENSTIFISIYNGKIVSIKNHWWSNIKDSMSGLKQLTIEDAKKSVLGKKLEYLAMLSFPGPSDYDIDTISENTIYKGEKLIIPITPLCRLSPYINQDIEGIALRSTWKLYTKRWIIYVDAITGDILRVDKLFGPTYQNALEY